MRKVIASGLIVLMIMSFCSFAYGAEKQTSYSKAERGTRNLVLGWTEIPKSILNTTKEKNLIAGLTIGTLEGIVNAFARTVSGTVDITTMPMGSYDKPAVKPEIIEEK